MELKNNLSEYKTNTNQFFSFLFLLLIITDISFIAVHIFLYINSDNVNFIYSRYLDLFNVAKDGSYPEAFQYLKFFWCGIICLFHAVRVRHFGFALVGLLLFYLMLDDMRQIHESAGRYITENVTLAPVLGVRIQNYGEVVYAALIGVPILATFALLIAFSHGKLRAQFMAIAALIVLLAFFGVVVDRLHVIVADLGQNIRVTFGILEDGGEMIAASLLLSYLYRIHAGLLR